MSTPRASDMPVLARHAIAALFATAVAWSVSAADAPAGCTAAEHRQFDFWLGEWDVKLPSGKDAGRNRITSIHGGCALMEEWRGAGGYSGTSLSIYDRDRKRWHQTWVDNGGGLLQLDGGLDNGSMALAGESLEAGPPRKRTLQRVRWTPQPDGRVRQLWEASEDDGREWKTVFDGWYTKRTEAR
jgi:hypothetical protein